MRRQQLFAVHGNSHSGMSAVKMPQMLAKGIGPSRNDKILRLRTLPGEQAQVGRGRFGHLHIGRAKRPLMGFVMVLPWAWMIYVRFFWGHTWKEKLDDQFVVI